MFVMQIESLCSLLREFRLSSPPSMRCCAGSALQCELGDESTLNSGRYVHSINAAATWGES